MNIKQIALDCGATTNDYGRPNYLELSIEQLEAFANEIIERCAVECDKELVGDTLYTRIGRKVNGTVKLYTHPKQWQGLSDEEISDCFETGAVNWKKESTETYYSDIDLFIYRAIEAKLREKNT
jgi:hypothetical protein